MKKIDLGQLASSDAKKITEIIGKKFKDEEKKKGKVKSKINLGKLAEKLAERREEAMIGGDGEVGAGGKEE